MPFSVADDSGYDSEHWTEVYEDLFVPAIQQADFEPARADTRELSRHILSDLLATIERSSVVLCDLSTANPNVLFELGWAFRADKPCVLVIDDATTYPFDLRHSYVMTYHSSLKARLVASEMRQLSELIVNTANDDERRWSMVRSLGLDAQLQKHIADSGDPVAETLLDIRQELSELRSRIEYTSIVQDAGEYQAGIDEPKTKADRETQIPRTKIIDVLEEERGAVGAAAKRLGTSPQRLYRLLKYHNIQPRMYR